MILSVSTRTDIVAFYTPWFMKRYEEGFIDVRNPFYQRLVNRIYFDDVDLIFFCTKNPIPMVENIKLIKKPILFHITLTPYKKNIEPNLPPKKLIIEAIKKISTMIGKENIAIRYDPIFISPEYNLNYHIKSFETICSLLDGYVNKIIVSFLDEYKNVKKNYNILKYKILDENDYKIIGENFSRIAQKYNMTIQTCSEERRLTEYGFIKDECLSIELAYKITGKKYKKWKARNCSCAQLVDIGTYNTCKHFCKYCYANYDENKVNINYKNHDINSSMLIGNLKKDDILKKI